MGWMVEIGKIPMLMTYECHLATEYGCIFINVCVRVKILCPDKIIKIHPI